MTDFLNDPDLNLTDDDFAADFDDEITNDIEPNQLHDDINGGEKTQKDNDIDIDESLDMGSPVNGVRGSYDSALSPSNSTPKSRSSGRPVKITNSTPSTPSNRIETLPSTVKSEKDLKKQHDMVAQREGRRFESQKDPYGDGAAPQMSPANGNTDDDARSQRSFASRRSSSSQQAPALAKDNRRRSTNSESAADAEIEVLKSANKQLQRQLMQLSRALDNQLNRKGVVMSKKSVVSEPANGSSSQQEEQINSLLKKLKMYKQNNAELKKQLFGSSSEKVIELKNALKVKRKQIKELQQEIVTLKNIQREQGKQLEVINNGHEELRTKQEEDLRFAQGEAKNYREENAKLQQQIDKMHQQVVYYKEQAQNAQEVLRKKNISVNSAKQVEQLQAELEAERKRCEELERKANIAQKALATWKRKQFFDAKKHQQEKESLEEQLHELGGSPEGGENGAGNVAAKAGSAYARARQLSERRKRKPQLSKPISPSAKAAPVAKKSAAGSKPAATGAPSKSAAKAAPASGRVSKQANPAKGSAPAKANAKPPAAKGGAAKKDTKPEKNVGESLDFAADLDLDEEFAADFDVGDDIAKEVEDDFDLGDDVKEDDADDVAPDADDFDLDVEAPEATTHDAAPSDGDIFKPPF